LVIGEERMNSVFPNTQWTIGDVGAKGNYFESELLESFRKAPGGTLLNPFTFH